MATSQENKRDIIQTLQGFKERIERSEKSINDSQMKRFHEGLEVFRDFLFRDETNMAEQLTDIVYLVETRTNCNVATLPSFLAQLVAEKLKTRHNVNRPTILRVETSYVVAFESQQKWYFIGINHSSVMGVNGPFDTSDAMNDYVWNAITSN